MNFSKLLLTAAAATAFIAAPAFAEDVKLGFLGGFQFLAGDFRGCGCLFGLRICISNLALCGFGFLARRG